MRQQGSQEGDVGGDALDPEFARARARRARARRRSRPTGCARSPWPAANRSWDWCDSRHSRRCRRARRARRRLERRERAAGRLGRAVRRHGLHVDPHLDRMAARRGARRPGVRPRSSATGPPATQLRLHQVEPVTSSVTVCSTCRRGLASMKTNGVSPRRRPGTRRCRGCGSCTASAMRTAASMSCSRSARPRGRGWARSRPASGCAAAGCTRARPEAHDAALPSPTICTSMWRARPEAARRRGRRCRTPPWPRTRQRAKASASSPLGCTGRMPRPPPPATALTIIAPPSPRPREERRRLVEVGRAVGARQHRHARTAAAGARARRLVAEQLQRAPASGRRR